MLLHSAHIDETGENLPYATGGCDGGGGGNGVGGGLFLPEVLPQSTSAMLIT